MCNVHLRSQRLLEPLTENPTAKQQPNLLSLAREEEVLMRLVKAQVFETHPGRKLASRGLFRQACHPNFDGRAAARSTPCSSVGYGAPASPKVFSSVRPIGRELRMALAAFSSEKSDL
jgi:hypothetical protein